MRGQYWGTGGKAATCNTDIPYTRAGSNPGFSAADLPLVNAPRKVVAKNPDTWALTPLVGDLDRVWLLAFQLAQPCLLGGI